MGWNPFCAGSHLVFRVPPWAPPLVLGTYRRLEGPGFCVTSGSRRLLTFSHARVEYVLSDGTFKSYWVANSDNKLQVQVCEFLRLQSVASSLRQKQDCLLTNSLYMPPVPTLSLPCALLPSCFVGKVVSQQHSSESMMGLALVASFVATAATHTDFLSETMYHSVVASGAVLALQIAAMQEDVGIISYDAACCCFQSRNDALLAPAVYVSSNPWRKFCQDELSKFALSFRSVVRPGCDFTAVVNLAVQCGSMCVVSEGPEGVSASATFGARALRIFGALPSHPRSDSNLVVDDCHVVSSSVLKSIAGMLGGQILNSYNDAYHSQDERIQSGNIDGASHADSNPTLDLSCSDSGDNMHMKKAKGELHSRKHKQSPRLKITTYNGSCWESLKAYLRYTQSNVVCVQEHRLGPNGIVEGHLWARKMGWSSFLGPGAEDRQGPLERWGRHLRSGLHAGLVAQGMALQFLGGQVHCCLCDGRGPGPCSCVVLLFVYQ